MCCPLKAYFTIKLRRSYAIGVHLASTDQIIAGTNWMKSEALGVWCIFILYEVLFKSVLKREQALERVILFYERIENWNGFKIEPNLTCLCYDCNISKFINIHLLATPVLFPA